MMIKLHWEFVIGITLALYALIIIALPISPKYATIFLFALIAFWSRLPGVGIYAPFFIIYNADLVDMFCMIVAINVGGVEGAIFSAFANLASRACGMFPEWGAVLSDVFAMGLICLIMPYLHPALGGNIFVSIVVFTILRALLWIPLDLLFWPQPPATYIFLWLGAASSNLFMNATYAYFFGEFLNMLLKDGVKFNIALFLLASAVIYTGKVYMKGFGYEKKILKKLFDFKLEKKKRRFEDEKDNDKKMMMEIKKLI